MEVGDILFLKQSAGPLLAVARVSKVHYFGPLEAGEALRIMEAYSDGLALDQGYKEAKQESKYGTLIFLDEVSPMQPLSIAKSDRRSWIVLDNDFTSEKSA